MTEKKSIGEGLGIAGFTLGILSIILAGGLGIGIAIVGFILCMVQQKKNPTKMGKAGLILNVIGVVVGIVFLVVYLKYLVPLMQQSGSFPAA
jgi:hypothetical protein